MLEDVAGSRTFSTGSADSVTSATCAQCEPAFIFEEHRVPVANLTILVFSGKCQTSSTVLGCKHNPHLWTSGPDTTLMESVSDRLNRHMHICGLLEVILQGSGSALPVPSCTKEEVVVLLQGRCPFMAFSTSPDTNNDTGPWWRLDLDRRFKIYNVTITNREDCCNNRLNGAEIRIGDGLDDNGNANPICTVISFIPAGNSQTFQCQGMEGRYVNIVIPNRNEYLTLCEVEVTGEPAAGNSQTFQCEGREGRYVNIVIPKRKEYLTLCEVEVTGFNIARGGNVTQSSIFSGAVPERAVDGNRASTWEQGSCAHTNKELRPWWRLKLDRRFKIYTVTIINRGDCCRDRLNDAEIRIGDGLDDNGNANPRCTVIYSTPAGNSQTFQCQGMEGRYVNIVIPNRNEYLALCEVEVTGEPAGNIPAASEKALSSLRFFLDLSICRSSWVADLRDREDE
ncbi:uncharacterized protein LOC141796221 [Halichoeres trimaculatus]|uniref:uncharacterized protein LOC141796221 n=1 Tax=Halichoeres trimaculatus TaxID=147232 RepID=UPI003D9E1607